MTLVLNPGPQGRKVVGENECTLIVGIVRSAGPFIARTEIAGGIVLQSRRSGGRFHLPSPGALGAMRRHKHPVAREQIETAMRFLIEVSQLQDFQA